MLQWDKLEGRVIKDGGKGQDRYVVQTSIGSGGAGKVYIAKDSFEDDRIVAIKTSNPQQSMSNHRERFNKEAKILSKLKNPHIIAYYDSFEQDGVPMIVMEYVEGVSLESKLRKNKSIPVAEATKYIKQMLSALEDVHSHKVYHRDVKPDNIHITVEGNVKLLDFGIIQETIDQDLTRQGSVIGTVSYMSPEIILNPLRKANPRTDLYSLGIMFYELVTGVKPFVADPGLFAQEKNNNLATKIIREPVIPPHEVDGNIDENVSLFIMKLIEREPSDRYQSTKDAQADLDRIIKGETLSELSENYNVSEYENNIRKQIILLGSVVGAIFIAIIVAILIMIL